MKHAHNGYRAADALAGISRWPAPAPGIAIEERMQRIEYARNRMAALGVDALLVNAGASLRYFTGIPWQASERLVAMVLPLTDTPFLVAPEFERGSLEAMLKIEAQLHCWEEHENPYRLVADELLKRKAKRLALDPQASFMIADGLRRAESSLEILSGATVVDHCRMRKSPAELALIQQAMSMTLEVHRQAASILEPGISANAVRRFIDSAHHAFGADGGSTFCAVQFAAATAYPHGLPGDQCLADGDLVLIDTGCTVHGYHSDITRTYVFGKASARQRDVWNTEREAQQAAFDAVRPGVACESIDASARAVLARAGFGPEYRLPGLPHRTGHGIGLSIHEPAYLVRGDTTPLASGMCFSNEPMIVIPGEFGIRLEDHFHVTESAAQWFTQPSSSISHPFG